MLTRRIHARIYQRELAESKYGEIKLSAKQKCVSSREPAFKAIGKYLENRGTKHRAQFIDLNLSALGWSQL